MALTYDDITSITRKYFEKKMYDNIFASNAGLQRAKKKWYTKISGGTQILVPLLYAQNSSAERQTTSSLNVSTNAKKTAADFAWKRYHAPIVIDGLDELKNSGDEQVIDHVKSEVQVAEKSLADLLGTDLFAAGTTSGSIQGFKLGCAATGTCGGLAKATYSWWQGQTDSTTTSLTLAKYQSLVGDCTQDADKPTVAFMAQDRYDDLWSLLQPQQRFTDSESVKAGFNSIMVSGIPNLVDSHCDSTHLYLINEDYVEFRVHRERDFVITPFQKPTNEDASYAHIFWAGALTWKNPRMCGMFTALT